METEVAFYGDSRGGARGTELQLGFLFLHRRGSSKPKTDMYRTTPPSKTASRIPTAQHMNITLLHGCDDVVPPASRHPST